MRGAGRVRGSGYEIMWGVGRHGPGNNVFSYFVEPNGFVTEYTTEVDQVDDSYVAHDAQWWLETKLFPCRWKMAGAPSELARKAMSGELVEEENLRCEQVMARALGADEPRQRSLETRVTRRDRDYPASPAGRVMTIPARAWSGARQ